ncbi:hypothetical protein B296_00049825 [Ensete ventricosum]|uniref:Uncharacterized protein n=1 Tax=Ensete ventricosum TaxID=4639 RepID=A0A426XC35_ENSVE|nr:hypothetical protein B296_00049825 [Ensete ventricosum]
MVAVSVGEVERESCQTSDVDVNYRAGPESSYPRMKMTLAMNRSRLTVAASQKYSQWGGDLLLFDSKKELVVPSLQSTKRRWAVALTGALGKENKSCRRDDANERV